MNKLAFANVIVSALLTGTGFSVTTVLGYDENDRAITGNPFASFDLGLNSTTALWDGVSNDDHPGYPKFPGYGEWPAPLSPNSGNSAAVLEKVANGSGGGPYPSSSSIYFGGMSYGDIDGGVLRAYDPTPVENLATVIFQIQIGDAIVWAFHQNQMPTLSYTTTSGTVGDLEATYESYIGFVESPGFSGFDVGVRTYAFQWDISDVEEEITEIWVSVNPVQHAQIYGMQLDQSSGVFSENILPGSIPEPSVTLLCLVAALGSFIRRRR